MVESDEMRSQAERKKRVLVVEEAFWVWGKDADGQRAIGGPRWTEGEAYELGFRMFPGGDFEVKLLPTINKDKAVSMLKGDLVSSGHSLKDSLRRVRHKARRRDGVFEGEP